MTGYNYKPYIGGGGPTEEQQEENTRVLGELLSLEGIEWKENWTRMEELAGVKELLLEIQTKDGIVYAGYDRWGYVLESDEKDPSYNIQTCDQATLKITLKTIKELVAS